MLNLEQSWYPNPRGGAKEEGPAKEVRRSSQGRRSIKRTLYSGR